MPYGRRVSWQRPNDAVNSSRSPSVEGEDEHSRQTLRLELDEGCKVAFTLRARWQSPGNSCRSAAVRQERTSARCPEADLHRVTLRG